MQATFQEPTGSRHFECQHVNYILFLMFIKFPTDSPIILGISHSIER